MESIKTRLGTKMVGRPVSGQPLPRCEDKEELPTADDLKFTNEEKKTIGELKKLYLETIKLDVELQRDIYKMEKTYESKHNEIFDKRRKILQEFRQQNRGDASPNGNVSNFWLKVLKASYTEFICKDDEQVLAHLIDIRSKLQTEPSVKFVIEFYFEPNEFFYNTVLTKTYYLNCLPDPEEPLSYDGAEIYKCEGCKIDWKNPKQRANLKKELTSFFDFFTPPRLPDDPADPTFCDINAILQNDFELGFYLKERVVPKAVIFFTGEIADCQSSDSESDEEDSDEDDEDTDADEEEDSSAHEDK